MGGDDYEQFVAAMRTSAEQIQTAAVAEIRKTHGDDPLLLEIEGMLKAGGVEI